MPLRLNKELVLASNSPRRKEILYNAGFRFSIEVRPTEEYFSSDMPVDQVPVYLAETKLAEFDNISDSQIVLCADTVVICEGQILNKPQNHLEAFEMLQLLAGKSHEVITGVATIINGEVSSFSDKSIVEFKELREEEINFYIEECQPFDKAGAYGIQEYMGMVGVKNIKGSFYTVMGLPIHKVYKKLSPFIQW